MGVSLESLALALAAMGLGAPMEDPKPEITYRFRTVEVRGLAWRDAGIGLKPVAQHNAVSVWTCPDDFIDRLPAEAHAAAEAPSAVKGLAQTPVHLASSRNQQFVTRVVYKGKAKSPQPVVESVREGVTATVVGRKIDQGVLTQLVIDDVDVRSVHTLKPANHVKQVRAEVETPASEPCPYMARQAAEERTSVVAVSVTASMEADPKATWQPSTAAEAHGDCKDKAECCQAETRAVAAKSDAAAARAAWFAEGKLQIPEIGRASAAGEWLIPDGEVLVIGFGPHTIADADGKAVVREHLVVVSAEVDDEESPIVVPDRVRPEEPKADSAPPAPIETPRTAVKLPELPGRTLPQGVHPDGTPAALPTLPEDEEPVDAADESDETRATPQSRKKPSPQMQPSASPAESEPKSDAKALKSSFSLPALKSLPNFPPLNSLVNSGVFPIPFHGAQFLVPLKPLALKLPFNQKLEFELVGRVVTDPEAAGRLFVEN
ncbi:hypothetical protein [Paludisphaera rhizosphaerae]|uniref:hypothetical protein n=1 Tax=Paludisphaera rhizosphaerae TaxID=2711216 RepID=UPI0013EB973F|nr:hypothetical protein [Paludisphaera rhizosphaerae]